MASTQLSGNPSVEAVASAAAHLKTEAPADHSNSNYSSQNVMTSTSLSSHKSSMNIYPNKPVQSCQFCRRRKIRCDKSLPSCSHCLKANSECVYPMRKSRSSASSLATGVPSQAREEQLLKRIGKLESAIESLKARNVQAATSPEVEIADPLGKLTIGKPYLNDGFWGSNELNELLEDSAEDLDTEEEETPPPVAMSRGTDFIFGVSPIYEDLSYYHPPRHQILHYWQVYLDNCEGLLKLLHNPTVSVFVQNAVRNDFHGIDQSDELLMFCFYFAAITSLTDDEVMRQFGQEKSSLLKKHELAIKHGLTRARFLQTQDLKVLQALVLYLTCVPNSDPAVSAVVWNMLGLAFRIAQSMAIDRDGELFKLKPFDTELRRRLWYQLLFLDLRGAEARGCLSIVLQYDTRPPTNLNDSDLFPDMTEPPKPRTGLTEMTVPLMRIEAARLGRRLQATNFRDTILTPLAKRELIERVQKDMTEKYMQYCQGAGPFYEYAAKVVNMIISRTNLVVYQNKIKTASQTDRDWLFNVCIQILEFYQELSGNMTCRRWTWLLKIHIQWHAVAFVLKELCDRTPGSSPDIERAWRVIDASCDEWKPPPDIAGTLVYDSVKKLLSKARRRRDRRNRTSTENSVSPSLSLGSTSGSSSQYTNISSSVSVQQQPQQPQQFQGQVPFVFPENYDDPVFNAMAAGMDMSAGIGVGIGGSMLEDQQFFGYDPQTIPPLEEFTSLPEWFFPSVNGPPVQDFEMNFFNTDDKINFQVG